MKPHYYEDDDGRRLECGDEGHMCEPCFEKEAAYWASHFGLRPGMSREESRAQLERMRPYREPTQEDLEALRDAGRIS